MKLRKYQRVLDTRQSLSPQLDLITGSFQYPNAAII